MDNERLLNTIRKIRQGISKREILKVNMEKGNTVTGSIISISDEIEVMESRLALYLLEGLRRKLPQMQGLYYD